VVRKALALAAEAYVVLVVAWVLVSPAIGDLTWWLYVLNVGTDYLLMTIPIAVFLAMIGFGRFRWLGTAASALVVAGLVCNLVIPTPGVSAGGPSLKVMTYNISGETTDSATLVREIREADADVVCLQELNRSNAEAFESELAAEYPYQVLRADRARFGGMGVLSRYPIDQFQARIVPLDWIGYPQLIDLDWNGRHINLINAHAIHAVAKPGLQLDKLNQLRMRDAKWVTETLQNRGGPAIMCADFNSTPRSSAYAELTSELQDSWREAGLGPGYSWAIYPLPMTLFRIDYVLHSRELRAIEAGVRPWHEISDHRAVTARLVWQP